jgi:hypothetical protein
LFSFDVLLVVSYVCGWVCISLTPFLSRDVRVIFLAVGARQGGHAAKDIKAFQDFTHHFQHIIVTATFRKYVVSFPVCPERLWYTPKPPIFAGGKATGA